MENNPYTINNGKKYLRLREMLNLNILLHL